MKDIELVEEMEGMGEVEEEWTQAEIADADLKEILYSEDEDN